MAFDSPVIDWYEINKRLKMLFYSDINLVSQVSCERATRDLSGAARSREPVASAVLDGVCKNRRNV